jgi:N-acetylmuramoyl-L-alanine amidase
MRKINRIILHCSATPEGRDVSVATINSWHLKRGWKEIGYHYVILLDGTVENGRDVKKVGAHTSGHNQDSIGVCYVGGMDAGNKKAKDTLNQAQEVAMVNLIKALREEHGPLTLHGHNEYAAKACPSFIVKNKFEWLL